MPASITAGQTPLLLSDFITRVQSEDKGFKDPASNFFVPCSIALPLYASTYAGSYYEVASDTADPTAFGAAESTTALGSTYEFALPTACQDNGVSHLAIIYGGTEVPASSITKQEDESTWSQAAAKVYWRHAGRKLRVFVGVTYSSSTKYSIAHKRYPTIPSSSTDQIDAPAEDIATLYSAWRAKLVKP